MVEVGMTDKAQFDYAHLQTVAGNHVSLRPLPSNGDARNQHVLGLLEHYDRTRRLLRGLKDPSTTLLDSSCVGRLSFIKFRCEASTSVFFLRDAGTVTVLHICDDPLDHNALLKLIFRGEGHILKAIGLHLPDASQYTVLTVN